MEILITSSAKLYIAEDATDLSKSDFVHILFIILAFSHILLLIASHINERILPL